MKKLSLLLCCVLVLQMLCACSGKEEEFKIPTNFYYCRREFSYNSSQAVIQPEVREGFGYQGNVDTFIRAYLYGPVSEGLETLIPSNVYLVSSSVDDQVAEIIFSKQFSELSGVKLTTACSAVLLTIHEFSGVESVRIYAKDAQLDDKDYIELTLDDVVLLDAIEIQE